MAPTTATTIDALQWWISNGTPIAGHSTLPYNASGGATVSVQNKLLNTNVTASVTVGDITAGALVVTAIYTPLSDGARLN
jgi:hypothetical protein